MRPAPNGVTPASRAARRLRWAGFAAPLAIGLVHTLVVARRYHVGSFDDDASYILAARALATGHGITSRMAGGYPLIGIYPLGYPALLSPFATVWPSSDTALRALSLVLFVSIFPLTWVYLNRRRVPEVVRFAALALLALNPVLATYATMVMPETAFVVVFLLMLIALDRWQMEPKTVTGAGMASVVAAAGLLWLKEAGFGLLLGVVAWLLLRRLFRKALVAAVGPAVLFLPLLVLRSVAGANLIGSRYSGDLGGRFHGGVAATLRHGVPAAMRSYFTQAFPHSILPINNGLLPTGGAIGAVSFVLAMSVTPIVVVGFVVWCRRHADVACLAVSVYLAETLVYPFINERRVVLVMPAVVVWYTLGAASVFGAVNRFARRLGGRWRDVLKTLPAVVSLLVLLVLAAQFTRDYLYFEGADSSRPGGSSYMAFLRRAGQPDDVVETDYLWTTALDSSHRTANGAYLAGCDSQAVADAISADNAGFFLTAALNGSGPVDDACLLPVLGSMAGAVRLYRTSRDLASVYELVGPGTGHAAWRDVVSDGVVDAAPQPVVLANETPQGPGDPAGRYPSTQATNGTAVLTWSWSQPVAVSQVSLGAAGAASGRPTTSVQVSVRELDGTWRVVAASSGAVGPAFVPFLIANLSPGVRITAARIAIAAPSTGTPSGAVTVAVHDFHLLGPTP